MEKSISELKSHYKLLKKEINQRLRQFSMLKAGDYFYELCFCLLTPQSNAKKCWIAVERLKECRFHGNKIENCLKNNTRFYRNKARYIKEAAGKWSEIKENIRRIKSPLMLREWLAGKEKGVKNVKGLGYKEASHFIRNIGKSNDKIAILDRHILKNLKALGIIKQVPNSLNKKAYLEIEKKMLVFSKRVSVSADELDLLLWAKENGEIFK